MQSLPSRQIFESIFVSTYIYLIYLTKITEDGAEKKKSPFGLPKTQENIFNLNR